MNKVILTAGMANKLLNNSTRVRLRCCECGLPVPVYRGRYPELCPNCRSSSWEVAESTIEYYYNELFENFISQKTFINELHGWNRDLIKKDILRFNCYPYLINLIETKNIGLLFESLTFINAPANRTPNKNIFSLLEAADHSSSPYWSYIGAKAVGIYPSSILSETDLSNVIRIARRVKGADWLSSIYEETTERQEQLLAEAYSYARVMQESHESSLEYAYSVFLLESYWNHSLKTPGSVQNKRMPHDNRTTVGGFRIHPSQMSKERMERAQRKVKSIKNRKGLTGRIRSAQQMLQRRAALKKAVNWHKNSSKSSDLHRGIAKVAHRSNGSYKKTNEGIKKLQHLDQNETALRLFSDGSKYISHPIYSFWFDKINLLESAIKIGNEYILQDEAISTVRFKENEHTRLPIGTRIRIESFTPAEKWGGSFPDIPMGQYVIEVKILSGERAGDYIEFDGSDLSFAIGIDEGVRYASHSLIERRINKSLPHGAIYLRKENGTVIEAVISTFDFLLPESQVGAILRTLKRDHGIAPTCQVRVHNDFPDYKRLNKEIFLSNKLQDCRIKEFSDSKILFEKDEKAKAQKDRILQDFQITKEREKEKYNIEKERVRQGNNESKRAEIDRLNKDYSNRMQQLTANMRRRLDALKEAEEVFAGGPGKIVINKPTKVRDPLNWDEELILEPGTQVTQTNVENGTGYLITTGPNSGRKVVLTESLQEGIVTSSLLVLAAISSISAIVSAIGREWWRNRPFINASPGKYGLSFLEDLAKRYKISSYEMEFSNKWEVRKNAITFRDGIDKLYEIWKESGSLSGEKEIQIGSERLNTEKESKIADVRRNSERELSDLQTKKSAAEDVVKEREREVEIDNDVLKAQRIKSGKSPSKSSSNYQELIKDLKKLKDAELVVTNFNKQISKVEAELNSVIRGIEKEYSKMSLAAGVAQKNIYDDVSAAASFLDSVMAQIPEDLVLGVFKASYQEKFRDFISNLRNIGVLKTDYEAGLANAVIMKSWWFTDMFVGGALPIKLGFEFFSYIVVKGVEVSPAVFQKVIMPIYSYLELKLAGKDPMFTDEANSKAEEAVSKVSSDSQSLLGKWGSAIKSLFGWVTTKAKIAYNWILNFKDPKDFVSSFSEIIVGTSPIVAIRSPYQVTVLRSGDKFTIEKIMESRVVFNTTMPDDLVKINILSSKSFTGRAYLFLSEAFTCILNSHTFSNNFSAAKEDQNRDFEEIKKNADAYIGKRVKVKDVPIVANVGKNKQIPLKSGSTFRVTEYYGNQLFGEEVGTPIYSIEANSPNFTGTAFVFGEDLWKSAERISENYDLSRIHKMYMEIYG